MKYDVQHETELRRYLLGEMTLEEEASIGERLFFDSDYAELEQAIEADLIDDYLNDDLSDSERDAFERHFLSQREHDEDLRIAQALKSHLDSEVVVSPKAVVVPPPQAGVVSSQPQTVVPFFRKPIVWWSLAAAALIVLSFLTWMGFRSIRGPAADEPFQAKDPGAPQPAATQPVERQQPSPSVPDNRNSVAHNTNKPEKAPPQQREPKATSNRVVFATILPGVPIRGPSKVQKPVTITDETESVVLKLPLRFSESYGTYQAELLSGERVVERWPDLKSKTDEEHGPHVLVTIDSDRLREQSYRIKVRGVPTEQQAPETDIYSFNVERK